MPEYSPEMMFEPRTAWIFVPPPRGRNEAPHSSEASIIRTDFLEAGHQYNLRGVTSKGFVMRQKSRIQICEEK